MFARALVVLLLTLNLGVAAWSVLRPRSAPPLETVEPAVGRLQLLDERPDATSAIPAPGPAAAPTADAADGATAEAGPVTAPSTPEVAASPPVAAAPAVPGVDADAAEAPRCFSAGPFADAGARDAARRVLTGLGASRLQDREATSAPRGWRVFMPAQPDRATADALATRIRGAGFDDLLVMPAGADANSIALGRYSAETSARQRVAALQARGFAAQAQPVGDVAVRRWLDFAVPPGFEPARARAAGLVVAPLDCGALS